MTQWSQVVMAYIYLKLPQYLFILLWQHPTHHFIDEHFLKRQREHCILLNASRGAVIDSQALLQYGRHLHWCFDVWESEPNINIAILEKTLIATPHIAGYSVQSRIRGIDMIYRLACERNIIKAQPIAPLRMPYQQLSFADKTLGWRDIVLGIFNPLLMTEMMRSTLVKGDNLGPLFDKMRHQFDYRYEFGFTEVEGGVLPEEDKEILGKFKVNIGHHDL